VAHQPEAEIARRHAGTAAADGCVADEVRQVGPVTARNDANAAIRQRRANLYAWPDHPPHETAVGPFPDIAAEIHEPVLVRTERADRLGLLDHRVAFGGCIIDGERSPSWIAVIGAVRQNLVLESPPRREGPFWIGRKPEARTGLPRQPCRIGGGIAP